MQVTVEPNDTRWLIRLEGEFTLAAAAELKGTLLEWLASGKDLELDLESTESIDITAMQLLWLAGQEAARTGVGIVARLSQAVANTAKEAGFQLFPGTAAQAE